MPIHTEGHAPRFFVLRHGQSFANVEGKIASSLANAGAAYGLTSVGKEQVRRSVEEARASGALAGIVHVVSSPLLRARETAEVAAEVLGRPVEVDERLIERGFGALELMGDDRYEDVWSVDAVDPGHEQFGVESTTAILARITALRRDLGRRDPHGCFLLCTHGDVASVTVCAEMGEPLSRHREVGTFANGEIRLLSGRRASARD